MSDVTTTPQSTLLSFIERASRDDTFNVEKFGELLRLQRDAEHDQARKAFNRAMAVCQAEMMPVIRTAQNKHLGNRYAKLEDIDREMRPIYTKHGFSVRFGSAPAPREGDMRITCTVAHEAGYFEENYLDSPLSALGSQGGRMAITPVQAVGSTVTYLRRYLSAMVFNVVLADDDDGEGQREVRSGAATPPPKPYRAERFYREPVDNSPDPLLEPNGPKWLLNLETALANAQSKEEVVVIGGHPSVTTAQAPSTTGVPNDVKQRITELLAAAFARFHDPDTGEVHIAGEEKLGAG
jgi:hypothetical protein